MIIDFKIKNYRSIRDETVFSLEASGSKSKQDNIAEITVKNGKKFRLLKTAVIYGANASGKSNIIRAFWAFKQLIDASFRYDINDDLSLAEAFELDQISQDQPIEFTLNFIGWDKIQYIYFISISKKIGVLEETLKYYPEKHAKIIYKRKGRKVTLKNSDFFKNTDVEKINPKRLFLSELGNSGDEYWEDMRNYFVVGNTVINSSASGSMQRLNERAKNIFQIDNKNISEIKNKVVKLVQLSDLGINGLELIEEEDFIKPNPEIIDNIQDAYNVPNKSKRFKTYHNVYKDETIIAQKEFDLLRQGSTGTVTLIGLSTEILLSLHLKNGRPIWIDEIDNSMHPYLCKFLISLFQHPSSNPFNSQLIFATHETTLLEKNNFRKDQIWITSKDKYGCTKLYSVFDLEIDGLREDIPFDKWYMSGKFGGLPKIKELDFIFDRDEENSNEKKEK